MLCAGEIDRVPSRFCALVLIGVFFLFPGAFAGPELVYDRLDFELAAYCKLRCF